MKAGRLDLPVVACPSRGRVVHGLVAGVGGVGLIGESLGKRGSSMGTVLDPIA